MSELKHVFCAVDFSETSLRALTVAVGLGRRFAAPVTAVHVVLSSKDATAATRELQRVVDAASGGGVAIDVRVSEGAPWRELVAQTGEEPGSLLVLGTHGRSAFDRLLLGSVTERVLRTAACTLMTVPAAAPGAPPPVRRFRRILCATDFSAASEAALAWAAMIAEQDHADLVVLHVLASGAVPQTEGFPRSTLAAYRSGYAKWAEERLHTWVPESVRGRCNVQEATAAGRPHREILKVASERGCELVVVGAEGHRALDSLAFGSTAEHIVRVATCPVLTVRP